MFDKLQTLIENDEEIFYIGGISEKRVSEIEKDLNVILLEEYKIFLEKYGLIIGYGVEILGCGKEGEASVIRETKRYRNFGLPSDFIVIRNVDEWVYCLDLIKGVVISWDKNNKEPIQIADTFEEYLYSIILEAKESWDE